MGGCWRAVLGAGLGLALTGAGAQTIYSCIDAKGKRITADRYIAECADREQRILSNSGTVRQLVPPTLTAPEREAQEAAQRKRTEEQQRQAEERRALRALAQRYPNRAVHDAERAKALRSIDDATQLAAHAVADLRKERAALQQETEFYKEPAKMPGKLRRQLEENAQQTAAQQRFIANQDEEKKRVNARFDEELARLKPMWNPPAPLAAASAPVKR